LGTLEVIVSFPLTEDGWAKAWQSLTKWNPDAAQKVLAGTLATDDSTTQVSPSYNSQDARKTSRRERKDARKTSRRERKDARKTSRRERKDARKTSRRESKDARKTSRREYEAARELCRELQKVLKRPVILLEERPFDQAKRTVVDHRKVVIGLGVLGVGIASVATAGVASAILAISAASLPVVDFPTFFDLKVPDPNRAIILKPDAVAELLHTPVEQRAEVVLAAVNTINKKRGPGPDVRVTLSRADITSVKQTVPGSRIDLVRAGVQMGFTVIAAGLLLLALTLIPHDIHGLTTRAGSVMLIVGALIVGYAMASGSWLKGR
jgi:hypothetical protein